MALDCTELANDYEVGTRLRATFNPGTDEWSFIPTEDADDSGPVIVGATP
jgi:hypothetical protein